LRIAELPIRCPRRTLGALLALTVLFGAGIPSLRFDPSTERVFPEGHWAVETYESFRDTFGGDEAIFIAVQARPGEDAFSVSTLQTLRRLTGALEAVDGVEDAFALPDVPVIRLDPMLQPTLVDALPEDLSTATPEALAQWRREALATPLVDGNLVSADRRASLAMVVLERLGSGVEGAEKNQRIVEAVQEAVAQEEANGWTLHMAGTPMIKAYIMEAIFLDLVVFSGPLLLIAVLAAGLLLRSVRAPLLVLAVLLVSVILTMGAMGHLGIAIDSMNSMVPVLILVIGVADCLHLLVEQRAQAARLGPEADGPSTARAAVGHVLQPCFLTSATTAIGFGSLFTSDVRPVAGFGVAAAIGALVVFVVSMLLIPAAGALLAAPRANGGVGRTERLAALVVGWPRRSLAIGLVFTALSAVGWVWVYPDTNFLAFFRDDTRLVQDVEAIQGRFTGVAPAELLVQGPPDASRRPEVLKALLAFERGLEEDPIVDGALSAADLVEAAVGAMSGTPRIPDTAQELQDVRAVLEHLAKGRLPVEQLISPDGPAHPGEEWLRVSVRAQAVGSSRFALLLERIGALEREHLTPLGLRVRPTGTSVVFSQTADRILIGQVESFLWAYAIITVVLVVSLRSIPLGLLSAIPNLVPIVALVGVMGYFDVAFNSFNSMVASIALGIAVDDTIHILAGYKRFSASLPKREAVREAIAHEGAAILTTSLVLFAGFAVLLLASFIPTADFGLLTGVAILAALVGDLVLTPALLLLADRGPADPPAPELKVAREGTEEDGGEASCPPPKPPPSPTAGPSSGPKSS
jgi:predicted RND superfamily exporter protein